MSKILSVVIPSYNVEKYLEQTLQSFIAESIMEDIEVLIVDDGSKDLTATIGKKYEEMYPNSFRVISKENGGHGSTINRGIQECKGKYFKVVDGDDWVNTADFQKLVEKLKECDADYVVTNYYEVNDQTGEKTAKKYEQLEGKKTFDELVRVAQPAMHAVVFKSSILKDNQIRLDEHCFYVDVEYILYPVPYVKTVAYFELYVYMYRLAVATQSVSMQGFRKHIQNHIDVIMHLSEFAERYKNEANEEDQDKVYFVGKRIAQMVKDQSAIFMSYSADDKVAKEKFIQFDQKLKKTSEWIYQLSNKESGMLKLLRLTKFRGYRWIIKNGQKRNMKNEIC
ncbi:MAG: glycosyltransferase family 2 protein [Tyzzerella sp.]|nr:glycosyltransferase family 2 protein [Tyzzerella sp.]